MAAVWVFGSPAWDLAFRLHTLPSAGGYAHVDALGGRPGGSAANVARGLSSAGHEVHIVGTVGEDETGKQLVDDLIRWGVRVGHLRRRRVSGQALLFVDSAGERTIFAINQPDDADDQCRSELPYAELSTADCVYLDTYADQPPELVHVLGRSSALVVTGPPDIDTRPWAADVIVGSARHFPEPWLDAPFERIRDVVGPELQLVVVTQGARGATAYGPTETIHVPAHTVVQVDSTGAGDAFAAGLVHCLLDGTDLAEAGRIAAAWGAMASQRLQSVPPTWHDVRFAVAGNAP